MLARLTSLLLVFAFAFLPKKSHAQRRVARTVAAVSAAASPLGRMAQHRRERLAARAGERLDRDAMAGMVRMMAGPLNVSPRIDQLLGSWRAPEGVVPGFTRTPWRALTEALTHLRSEERGPRWRVEYSELGRRGEMRVLVRLEREAGQLVDERRYERVPSRVVELTVRGGELVDFRPAHPDRFATADRMPRQGSPEYRAVVRGLGMQLGGEGQIWTRGGVRVAPELFGRLARSAASSPLRPGFRAPHRVGGLLDEALAELRRINPEFAPSASGESRHVVSFTPSAFRRPVGRVLGEDGHPLPTYALEVTFTDGIVSNLRPVSATRAVVMGAPR